jgi:UDP:flavonoid glycosyltransferase YjiC (YdhE family)
MRLTIFTAGSRGDIQPGLLLGQALQRAGFQVRLAAPENFAAWVQGYGLDFHPLRGDVQQIMAGETGQRFMGSGSANPLRSILAMRKMLGPVALNMLEDALSASRPAEAILCLAVFATLGKTIAEILHIPLLTFEPTPLLPTRAFPAAGWPLQRNLGGLHNRMSGHAMLQVIWQWYRPFVNQFRQRYGLPPFNGAAFARILAATPLLGAYSPAVLPPPPDWPPSVHITGYWFEEPNSGWRPPRALLHFLEAGAPPVYIGFGSMGGQEPGRMAATVVEALQISGQRGLLATGWGGLEAADLPESVFALDAAPHGWLFPRMAAVVHHGGAGTTAQGLRAGVPSVIVPFIVDQRFWGQRVRALGVGPAPLPAKDLTASRLAFAIQTATSNPQTAARAAALGRAIRAEDGLGEAVNHIQQVLVLGQGAQA